MEYMGDRGYWDNKFASRSGELFGPEQKIVDNFDCFKKGSILDIACGDGRNSLFFLEKGFKVTGVDFSVKALERLEMFAKEQGHEISTKQIDLDSKEPFQDIGVFDNIIINHYRLGREQLTMLQEHIVCGGILFVCGFGDKHRVDQKIRKEDLIKKSDFELLGTAFEIHKYEEDQDDRGFFVTYIYKKL